MYNVSPIPDFNDHSKVQQFIQDRRVIGVRFFHLLSFYFISHSLFLQVRSSRTTCSSPSWDHLFLQRPENNRLSSLQCSTHRSWTWCPNPCHSRSLLYPLSCTSFGVRQPSQGKVGWLAQSSHRYAGLFVSRPPLTNFENPSHCSPIAR